MDILPERIESLVAFANLVDITPMLKPDMAWVFSDHAGHSHHWAVDLPDGPYWKQHFTLPTLKFVLDDPDDQESDWAGAGHYECLECGETIEPRCRRNEVREYAPGIASYTVNGREVTEETYKRAVEIKRAEMRAQKSRGVDILAETQEPPGD